MIAQDSGLERKNMFHTMIIYDRFLYVTQKTTCPVEET